MARLLCTFAVVLLTPALAQAQIVIQLKNKFIEDNKHRATIDATFTVDKAHKKPNTPAKDADMHIAGRAPEIKLPIVAELMNAAEDADSVGLIHDAEKTGDPIAMTGAWRLWCEHGGTADQIQGEALDRFTTTNPDHCFEIHPHSLSESKGDKSLIVRNASWRRHLRLRAPRAACCTRPTNQGSVTPLVRTSC